MKKVAPKKTVPARTKAKASASVKRTAPKKTILQRSRSAQTPVVSYQRIVIISTCVVLAVVAVVLFNKPAVTQSVAGVSVARGLFSETTIALPEVDGAVSYNIYYKQKNDKEYSNAVRDIPVTAAIYTISYLTKGAEYEYKVSAVDQYGAEYWWSPIYPLTDLKPM